jgi:hypothetical protein
MTLFWHFIHERQEIFRKRYIEKQPAPWTKDPTLLKANFCNIFRDLDYGTRFVLEFLTPRYQYKELFIKNVMVYRIFNWPDTHFYLAFMFNNESYQSDLDNIGFLTQWNAHSATRYLDGHAKTNKIRSNAYTVVGGIPKLCERAEMWWDNDEGIKKVKNSRNLYECWTNIRNNFPFTGEFVSYEIATDLGYAPDCPWTENDWVNPGPGCMLGIDFLIRNNKGKKSKSFYQEIIEGLRTKSNNELIKASTPEDPWVEPRNLTLRDIEHSLCEYFKYKRVQSGGHVKRAFVPSIREMNNWFDRSIEKLIETKYKKFIIYHKGSL